MKNSDMSAQERSEENIENIDSNIGNRLTENGWSASAAALAAASQANPYMQPAVSITINLPKYSKKFLNLTIFSKK